MTTKKKNEIRLSCIRHFEAWVDEKDIGKVWEFLRDYQSEDPNVRVSVIYERIYTKAEAAEIERMKVANG